jgi:hypothetical protein
MGDEVALGCRQLLLPLAVALKGEGHDLFAPFNDVLAIGYELDLKQVRGMRDGVLYRRCRFRMSKRAMTAVPTNCSWEATMASRPSMSVTRSGATAMALAA